MKNQVISNNRFSVSTLIEHLHNEVFSREVKQSNHTYILELIKHLSLNQMMYLNGLEMAAIKIRSKIL